MQTFGRAVSCIPIVISVAACSTQGHNFQANRLASLTPGQTTLAQASYELAAPPARLYPQSDGTLFAVWSYKFTLLTDVIYKRKEATLQFAADGRLLRLVDSTNILLKTGERQKLLGPVPVME